MIRALLLSLALLGVANAFTLTSLRPMSVAKARSLNSLVVMEEDAAEPAPAPPPPPAYQPTDAEISACMASLPRDPEKGWDETIPERRAHAVKTLQEQNDPAAVSVKQIRAPETY